MSKGDLIEVRLSYDEVKQFLQEKPKYAHEVHSFTCKILNYHFCAKCGLVALKNKLTGVAIKLGCNYEYHVTWRGSVKKFGGR